MTPSALIELHKKLRYENREPVSNADFWRFAEACVEHLPRIVNDYDTRISELTGSLIDRMEAPCAPSPSA